MYIVQYGDNFKNKTIWLSSISEANLGPFVTIKNKNKPQLGFGGSKITLMFSQVNATYKKVSEKNKLYFKTFFYTFFFPQG